MNSFDNIGRDELIATIEALRNEVARLMNSKMKLRRDFSFVRHSEPPMLEDVEQKISSNTLNF
jgi:hypothetical protein